MAAPLLQTGPRLRPMSWAQYLALDADVPGEYFDGRLVTAPAPTSRGSDLVVKMSRYAAAGLVHYWVVDRAAGEILVYELSEGVYELRQAIPDGASDVDLGIATVALRLADLT